MLKSHFYQLLDIELICRFVLLIEVYQNAVTSDQIDDDVLDFIFVLSFLVTIANEYGILTPSISNQQNYKLTHFFFKK